MRAICFDYGQKRIGVAVSDTGGVLASGERTLEARGFDHAVSLAAAEVKRLGAEIIVVGLPKNMNGSEAASAEKARSFGEAVSAASGIAVKFYDERMTTMQAHKYLNDTGCFGKKRKGVIDTLSAQIILQDYLDSQKEKPLF